MTRKESLKTSDILVIEDDHAIREAIAQVLEFEGYSVKSARNGQEGFDMLARGIPSLIILDLMMPVMSGIQFKTEVDKNPALKDIPVVIISADDRMEEQTAHLKIAGFLKKPIQLENLIDTVKRAFPISV